MIRRTVVFALGLALVATLAIPSGPVFAMSHPSSTASVSTSDGSVSLLDRLGEWTTDLWLWVTGTGLAMTKSVTEPLPIDESDDGLTGQSALVDPNGLD